MPTYYNENGLRIEMRTKEKGHNIPHVHAIFAGCDMSVMFNGSVLKGYIKDKTKRKEAIDWIKKNKDFLEEEWRKNHV